MKAWSPFIQVAGIKSLNEAKMLVENGVEYLGFPLRLDINKPDLSEDEAAKIVRHVTLPHKAVLITYLNKAHDIKEFADFLGIKCIQLHGEIEVSEVEKLRSLDLNYFLIKSLVITGSNEEVLKESIQKTSHLIDAYITDTFDPVSGAKGATGKIHDWEISQRLVQISPKPVILAGGLNPDNVASAIQKVKPAGVDVHTGVENSQGDKDPRLVKLFVERALSEFKKINSSRN